MKVYHWPPDANVLVFDIDMTLYTNSEYLDAQIRLLMQRLADFKGISYDVVTHQITQAKADYAQKNEGRNLSLGNVFVLQGVDLKLYASWMEELFNPEDYLRPDETLKSTLQLLSEKFKIAAVTNNSTNIGKRTLAALSIEEFFNPVIGLDISGASKPTIIPFEMVARHFKISFEQMVSIGDRFHIDIELPLKHGMGGILVEGVDDVYKIPDFVNFCKKRLPL